MKYLFILLILVLLILIINYYMIEKYNTIYINRNNYNDIVVVIEKTLFSVTVSRINQDPEKMDMIYFLLNYTTNV